MENKIIQEKEKNLKGRNYRRRGRRKMRKERGPDKMLNMKESKLEIGQRKMKGRKRKIRKLKRLKIR
jgi:hypothetical protein